MKRSVTYKISSVLVIAALMFTQNLYAGSPTGDHSDLLVSQSFITAPGNALIAGDDSQAQLLDNSDQMELDLSDMASFGTSYTVRWRRDQDTSSDQVDVVKESANAFAEIPFTSSNASYNDAVSSDNIMLFESLIINER
jgi:hypothetical protein